MKKVIAFAGSNSSKSINQQLIKVAVRYLEKAQVEILDLRDYPAPVYSPDDERESGFPKTIEELHQKLSEADGYIISSPEYNSSIPSVLKNTIDWLSRIGRKVFNDRPTIFLSASPGGRGGASVLNHLASIMPHQGARVIGVYGIGRFREKLVDGELLDQEDKTKIRELIQLLEEQL